MQLCGYDRWICKFSGTVCGFAAMRLGDGQAWGMWLCGFRWLGVLFSHPIPFAIRYFFYGFVSFIPYVTRHTGVGVMAGHRF